MPDRKSKLLLFVVFFLAGLAAYAVSEQSSMQCSDCIKEGCTSFAAGPGATVDGSAMSGHTCDGNCDFTLRVVPAGKHEAHDRVRIDYPGLPGGFRHEVLGETEIPQVAETYSYFQIECPIGNEHQVFFGENTCPTRKELANLPAGKAMLDYTQVAALALQRGGTAREAILAAGALVEKYGLKGMGGAGESFLVSDPNEAWCFEIVGESTLWAAQRVPHDHVCPHANRMRIGEVDAQDKENFLMAPSLVQNAIDKGFYDPKKDEVFNFARVYSGNLSRGNQIREWRMFSLLCPSRTWKVEQEFPFSVKPEKKISARWWIENIWRDHMEGTPYDKTMTRAAGPFHSPGQVSVEGVTSERTICTETSGYTWVSQARNWLPDSIGGLFWFGVDCPRSTCYVPFYTGISEIPPSWQKGDFTRFEPESPRWYFQAIDTFSWLRYQDIHADVRAVFGAIEDRQFDFQPAIEQTAMDLYRTDPVLAKNFLTYYCSERALKAETAAKQLFYDLIAKYADGRPRATVSKDWLRFLIGK